jgi:hypothetical protein
LVGTAAALGCGKPPVGNLASAPITRAPG